MKKNDLPKGYFIQNGCRNCHHVDWEEVASDIYPRCILGGKRYVPVEPYGICNFWAIYDYEKWCIDRGE